MALFQNYPPQQRALLTFLLIVPLAGIAGIILVLSNVRSSSLGASSYQYAEPIPEGANFELVGKGFDFVDTIGTAPKTGTRSTTLRQSTQNGTNLGGGYSIPNEQYPVQNQISMGSVRTLSPEDVTSNAATLYGRVSNQNATDTWFAISRTQSSPDCMTNSMQTSSSGPAGQGSQFSKRVSLTRDNETYYVRACANINGVTTSGAVETVRTLPEITTPEGPKVYLHFTHNTSSCSATGVITETYTLRAESTSFSGLTQISLQSNSGSLVQQSAQLVDNTNVVVRTIQVPSTYPWASLQASATTNGVSVPVEISKDTPTNPTGCQSYGEIRLKYVSSACINGQRKDTFIADAQTNAYTGPLSIRIKLQNQQLLSASNAQITPQGWTPLGTMQIPWNNASELPNLTAQATATGGGQPVQFTFTILKDAPTSIICTTPHPSTNLPTQPGTSPATTTPTQPPREDTTTGPSTNTATNGGGVVPDEQ
jgi:hypothetical protein